MTTDAERNVRLNVAFAMREALECYPELYTRAITLRGSTEAVACIVLIAEAFSEREAAKPGLWEDGIDFESLMNLCVESGLTAYNAPGTRTNLNHTTHDQWEQDVRDAVIGTFHAEYTAALFTPPQPPEVATT